MDTTTVTVVIVICVALVICVGIATCACTSRRRTKMNGAMPVADGSVVYYATVSPNGDVTNHEERLTQLRAYVRQRHSGDDAYEPTPKELADALRVTIASKMRGYVLCYFDQAARSAVPLDVESFIADKEQIGHTATTPLLALPIDQLHHMYQEELRQRHDDLRASVSLGRSSDGNAKPRSLLSTSQKSNDTSPPASKAPTAPASLNTSRRLDDAPKASASRHHRRDASPDSNGTGDPPTSTSPKLSARDVLDPPGRRLAIMTPRIYPAAGEITTETLIAVTANRYVDPRTHELAALPTDAVLLLDAVWFRWVNNKTAARRSTLRGFTVEAEGAGAAAAPPVKGLPKDHGLMVARVTGPEGLDANVVAVPGRARVCWSADGAWHECTKPLLLDEGKWCLRAESIDPPGEHVHEAKFASRVYSVTPKAHGNVEI